jgi:glycosyltransferase involved in cell wall biosynthesis
MKQENSEVGIGLLTWNGENYLEITLRSLFKQSFKNFKIFVHHNCSKDNTIKILNKFKKKYPKKIYILKETKYREIPTVLNILCKKKLKNYKYLMIVNDDDIYEKNFISKNLENIKKKKLDLSYSLYKTTLNNETKNSPLYSYNKKNVNLYNFLLKRNPVPICFGVYRTKKFMKNLKNYMYFDKSKTNYDNVFTFSCLLNMKVDFINEKLFTYRIKKRQDPILKFKNKSFIEKLIHRIRIFKFQYSFSKKIMSLIYKSNNIKFINKFLLVIFLIILYPMKVLSYLIKNIF